MNEAQPDKAPTTNTAANALSGRIESKEEIRMVFSSVRPRDVTQAAVKKLSGIPAKLIRLEDKLSQDKPSFLSFFCRMGHLSLREIQPIDRQGWNSLSGGFCSHPGIESAP
jgi:hypothetical protein